MKIKPLFTKVCAILVFFGASYAQSQVYQSTISGSDDRDHYSVVVSSSNSSRHVLAGTEENSSGETWLHVLEVDANGVPVWEKRYLRIKDEQVFDIANRDGGYVLTGYADNRGNDEILVMLLGNSGSIVQQNTFDPGIPGMQSYGVHVIEAKDDPIPGYLITGFALAGQSHSDSKQGIVMKLTNSLNVQWTIAMDSPPTSNDDADLNSHGLEVPELGYFISGSANGNASGSNSFPEAQATMIKYDGTIIWQKNYAPSHGSSGHRYVSTSAIYDSDQNEIFQLGNSTFSHHFFVNVFDANTGATNTAKRVSISTSSTNNTQGFEIIESIDADNYCIAGYVANENWISDETPTFGQTLYGSPSFLLEAQKATQTILWDKRYNIPNSGYPTSTSDIFSAYTGLQTYIYTPNIVVKKQDNTGFTFASVRKEPGTSRFDLELLDLTTTGNNRCTSEVPNFVSTQIVMHEESNTIFSSPNAFRSPSSLQVSTPLSNLSSCGELVEICNPNSDFTFEVKKCKVQFNDLSSGSDLGCYNWDFGDGTTVSGVQNPVHIYTAPGTYEVCLEVCCENPNGTFTYSTSCYFVTINCEGTSCQIPSLTDYFDYQISEENCFQYFFEASTMSNPDLCYNWYVNSNLVGTGAIFDYTFAANLQYTVCLEIYCCTNPSVTSIYCETIEVGCSQSVCGCSIVDLLPNGDFEDTSIPVTSGIPINCTCSYGSICVGHEPRDKCMNSLWIDDLWDHTLGNSDGHFLIVDGINGVIWSDQVAVTSGDTYVFEFWEIREISDNAGNNSTQTFDVQINGSTVASFNTASAPSNAWTNYCLEWTAGSGTSIATIEIVQTSGTDFNDYGIDDIQFGKCEGVQFNPVITQTDTKFDSFEVYPNPASTQLNVELEGDVESQVVQIYSPDGKMIQTVGIAGRSFFSLDLSDLQSGTYLIRIGEITKRFVVKR